ncbi:MAG: hypothetical protein U0625_04755 [Phycisphaerales bacterium]
MTTRFEDRVTELGRSLSGSLTRLVAATPGRPQGPVQLARALGVDKVLASRVLRAAGSRDPVTALRFMPGPAPLRRFAQAAGGVGVDPKLVGEVELAVAGFEDLIRAEAGDRSGLDAMLTSWIPEARGEFELRRKQSAYRAMSQLLGKSVETELAIALLHPAEDPRRISIVWITGFLGLQRLRPGVSMRFASRRVGAAAAGEAPRALRNVFGEPADGIEGLCLPDYCSRPMPKLESRRAGEVVHYILDEPAFGPRARLDLVYAELNAQELPRFVPFQPGRKRYVFAEIAVPAERLEFDVLIHRDLLGATAPALHLYDTAYEGVANVNDRARDMDRMELHEELRSMGTGLGRLRLSTAPWNTELLQRVCDRQGWASQELHAFRSSIDYPLYGSQVAVAWDAEFEADAGAGAAAGG